ncbi:hypothetical protein [Leptospira noguchii]|nr:hypothetical protein [Leptospira noguchii]UOG30010.1 hypothetical protein MAL06_15530 [Leptospira noguchii]
MKLKRLASIGARETKASRFYWRSTDTKVKIIIWKMFKFIFAIKTERK